MTNAQLSERLTILEKEVADLKAEIGIAKQGNAKKSNLPWWENIFGAFAGNETFLRAMEHGRKYRASLRPRKRKPNKKKQTAKK